MATYKYNVDSCVSLGNKTITSSFGYDTMEQALKSFNEYIEIRYRSHIPGQVWDVTLYDMDLCDIMCRISSIDFNLE